MKFRAVVKQSGDWWIGWLVDLHGVNAQERTREDLLESLRIGAADILALDVEDAEGAQVMAIEVPEPKWSAAG